MERDQPGSSARVARPRAWKRPWATGCFAILILVVTGFAADLSWMARSASLDAGGPSSLPLGVDPLVYPTAPRPAVQHVVVAFLENQNVSTVLRYGAYERYLAQRYAFASQFYSIKHGSSFDYVAATSGNLSNQRNQGTSNVADLAEAAGLTWGGFMESMPRPCYGTTSGAYNPDHNPFVYYADIANDGPRCRANDVDLAAWTRDMASSAVPDIALISPNEYDDGHTLTPANATVATPATTPKLLVDQADSWLRGFLPPLLNGSLGPTTAVFTVYDESSTNDKLPGTSAGGGGGHVFAVVAGASALVRAGYNSTVPYNTYSVLTTTEWLLGLGHTQRHDNWTSYPPMYDLFATSPLLSISGRVVAKCSGTPVPGARISDTVYVAAVTNASGGFAVGNVSDGSYNLSASAPNYGSAKVTVLVNATARVGLTFGLRCPATTTVLVIPGSGASGAATAALAGLRRSI